MSDEKEQNNETNNRVNAVLYTDGGANPNPGPGGWGIHGYVFDDNKPTQGSGCPKGQPTEKGYVSDRKAQHVNVLSYFDGWGSFKVAATNNYAEAFALKKALDCVLAMEQLPERVLFLCDSKLTLNSAAKWVFGWAKNGWTKSDGEPIGNLEVWKEIYALILKCQEKNIVLKYDWVKGHSGNIGNSICDLYANWGVAKSRTGEEAGDIVTSGSKGYWSPKTEVNRFFAQNHWYFNTHTNGCPTASDGRFIYHLGNQGKDDDLGYSAATAVYSVVAVKEKEPVLEAIRDRMDELALGGIRRLAVSRLDIVFKPAVYTALTKSARLYSSVPKGYVKRLQTLSGDPLAFIQEPARLAFRATDALSLLEAFLKDHIEKNHDTLTLTDITEVFYYHDEKDKKKPWKLRKEVDSKMVTKEVTVQYDTGKHKGEDKLILTLGADIPRRNTLSAIASQNPKVYAVTWHESDKAYRYGTIVETEDDVGIWASIYSNLKLLEC